MSTIYTILPTNLEPPPPPSLQNPAPAPSPKSFNFLQLFFLRNPQVLQPEFLKSIETVFLAGLLSPGLVPTCASASEQLRSALRSSLCLETFHVPISQVFPTTTPDLPVCDASSEVASAPADCDVSSSYLAAAIIVMALKKSQVYDVKLC